MKTEQYCYYVHFYQPPLLSISNNCSAAMGNRSVRGKPLPTPNYPDSSVSIERNVDDDELDDFDDDYDVKIPTG